MSCCTTDTTAIGTTAGSRNRENRWFPDLRPLPKLGWRAAFAALAEPAFRLHRYRNLRSAAIYAAMRRKPTGND